jgi:hypothetical protein
LERLDDLLEQSDLYRSRFRYIAVPESKVVGATTDSPMAQDIPNSEFHAQIDLVKAAKSEVTQQTRETFADLGSAFAVLGAFRQQSG